MITNPSVLLLVVLTVVALAGLALFLGRWVARNKGGEFGRRDFREYRGSRNGYPKESGV